MGMIFFKAVIYHSRSLIIKMRSTKSACLKDYNNFSQASVHWDLYQKCWWTSRPMLVSVWCPCPAGWLQADWDEWGNMAPARSYLWPAELTTHSTSVALWDRALILLPPQTSPAWCLAYKARPAERKSKPFTSECQIHFNWLHFIATWPNEAIHDFVLTTFLLQSWCLIAYLRENLTRF